MKHLRKKSHRADRKTKKHKKKHSIGKYQVDPQQESLKHLEMASGFQVSNLPSTSASCHANNEDNDIIVVYDKREEMNNDGNMKVNTPVKYGMKSEMDLQSIPLPPERWFSRSNDSLKLEDIPLPPSPKTHRRLTRDNDSGWGYEAYRLHKCISDFRQWEHTELGKKFLSADRSQSLKSSCSRSFTIMSYNVLAQDLLENHNYLYRKHDRRALPWWRRSETLWQEIKEANADILCLQEVQASHLDSFYCKLKDLGYEGIYKQRSEENVDGCGIYYKIDRFKLVDSTSVEYYQDYGSVGCILDRNNIAIIARLAFLDSVDSNTEVVVATTHLLYNPKRHDVKLAQCQVLLAELDRISYNGFDKLKERPKYLPVIVTGDFNLLPVSAVYKLLTGGYLRYSELAARSLNDALHGQARQEHLLPFELQISHSCQHLGLLLHRFKQRNHRTVNEEINVSKISKLYNSDIYKSPQQYFQTLSNVPLLHEEDFCGNFEKGSLYHRLNLQSVYKHERPVSPSSQMTVREATTCQNDWVTVDYIFYSGEWNEDRQSVDEGPLKLLSHLSLPSVGQCQQLKSIPNLVCGSDHFSLMACFLLDVE